MPAAVHPMPEWKLLSKLDSAEDRAIFDRMYALYEASFPEDSERESRETWEDALSARSVPYQLEFCVALEGAAVAGAAAFEYYPRSVCGLVTFLFVAAAHRSQGIARELVGRLERRLLEISEARLRAIFAEAEDPERAREDGVKTVLDPALRLRILSRLGARRVAIPYIQPSLGPGKDPAMHLQLLLLRPRSVAQIPREQLEAFLREFYGVLLPDEHTAAELVSRVLRQAPNELIPVTTLPS